MTSKAINRITGLNCGSPTVSGAAGTSVGARSGLPGGRGVTLAGYGVGVCDGVTVGARGCVSVIATVGVAVGAGVNVSVAVENVVAVGIKVGA